MSIFNASRLVGKTVLVTGASSGIGAAAAVLFAKGGSNLVLLARRVDALKVVADACIASHIESGLQQGGQVATVQIDVSQKDQVAALWDKVPGNLRDVDILDADIEGMFATNVLGLISMTQLVIRDFKAKNAGHVINIGSIAGREPYAGGSIYTATKHAVNAFTGSLMRELVDTPIRVTEIQPGMVETEFSIVRFRGDKSKADKVYEGLQPLTAQDIAEEIVWAASRPPHVNIAELFVLPVNQASPTVSFRPGRQ
jgi:3-hydroxy acid dehydrogenase/malonic semialdehyde reductase